MIFLCPKNPQSRQTCGSGSFEKTVKGKQSTNNILNLTEGILNDLFGIQIIATYNTSDSNIDQAIKRDMRLIADKYFGLLDIEQANKLAKSIHTYKFK